MPTQPLAKLFNPRAIAIVGDIDRDWATARHELAQAVADLNLSNSTTIWDSLTAHTQANATSTHRRHPRDNSRQALAL